MLIPQRKQQHLLTEIILIQMEVPINRHPRPYHMEANFPLQLISKLHPEAFNEFLKI